MRTSFQWCPYAYACCGVFVCVFFLSFSYFSRALHCGALYRFVHMYMYVQYVCNMWCWTVGDS